MSTSDPRQSRAMSLVETLTTVAVGYGVAVLTQTIVFPWFGLDVSLHDNLAIGGVFTVVSIIRAYAVRRVFEGFTRRLAYPPVGEGGGT